MKPWEQYQQAGIDRSRPIIENGDGSFSTERTITASFDEGGREVYYNIPTIVGGRDVGEDEAIRLFQAGQNQPVGSFGSLREAEAAAVNRSSHIGDIRGGDRAGPWTQYQEADEAPALEIDIVGGTRESAPDAAALPAPSLVDREARGLGLGARSVLQGAGGLLGALGGDAFNAYVMPGEQPSYRDAAGALADRIGLPSPQDGRERVLGDVGEALTGTGLTMGVGGGVNALARLGPQAAAQPTNALSQLLTAQPGLQAVSTATGAGASSVTRESGGSEGQQLAAGLIGGLAPGVGGYAAGATTRGLVRGTSGEQMQRTIGDFNALGANPTVGQASQNRFIQGAENLLGGAPTSAGVVNRFAERQADDIGAGLQRLANNTSRNASAERAGRAVERGIETFRGNSRAQQRALYWQADQLIPDQTPVNIQNAWRQIVDLTTPQLGATATTGAMIPPRIAQLRDNLAADVAANGGTLPYSALRAIRTQVGEQISDFSMTPDSPTRQLRQLYGALSRDMEQAAASMGPDAERAARRANNYTRVLNGRLEQVERVIDKNGGPEAIFNASMSGTRDGGTTLRAVMQSLPREGQQAVTGAVIRRMGMATPGAQDAAGDVFSASTFLTNWNKVSPEAKRALFDRHGPQYSRDMDRIARVADNIKTGSRVLANPSGTANRAAAFTYGASLVASLFDPSMVSTGGLVLGGVGANGMARVLTSPRSVSWLARATEAPRGSIPAMANAMIAEGEREDDPVLLELAAYLRNSVDEGGSAPNQQNR